MRIQGPNRYFSYRSLEYANTYTVYNIPMTSILCHLDLIIKYTGFFWSKPVYFSTDYYPNRTISQDS